MKVILKKDTPNLGQRFDIVEVSEGYARNMLIPQGFVEIATQKLVAQAEVQRAERIADQEKKEKALQDKLTSVSKQTVTITTKANEKGHLFKGVDVETILKALNKETQSQFAVSNIQLKKPLKEVGEHKVPLSVGDKDALIVVSVVAE